MTNDLENSSKPDTLIQEVRELMSEMGLTQKDLANRIGLKSASAAVNQWLQGKYAGDNAKIADAASRWVATCKREADLPLVDVPAFIETPTAGKIADVLTDAQANAEMVVVYGGAGVGKTKAVDNYKKSSPNVWHITMSPCVKTAGNCLEWLCSDLGIGDIRGKGKALRAIIQFLKNSHGLLVIDEAQHLELEALEIIRSIYDASGVGVALVGNESVYTKLTGGRRSADFAQLYSRVGQRLKISKPTKADVLAIIERCGIDNKESRGLLQEIASKNGGLRGMFKTLRVAYQLTETNVPTVDDFHAAWTNLSMEV
ncbi:AAA family ATPase [Beggiatoa leptomitoformis]|uniref:AAA family ATPase n=1 Tax=Beggiatoa leptomitoformis TaxID=288004 RepID=A0A2N9YH81_9GAMM|nr:AAA family ATPase [Beggiatoa leptomitoformis]AUI69834.1 AAA family ATPase [Beggiatoa leptomitoformis]QGX03672.1 AAA family ATPase [Beggiatoa leptomitoformis]